MSALAQFAWWIQIAIFILLFFTLPHGPNRLFIIFGYIIASSILVGYVRKKYL